MRSGLVPMNCEGPGHWLEFRATPRKIFPPERCTNPDASREGSMTPKVVEFGSIYKIQAPAIEALRKHLQSLPQEVLIDMGQRRGLYRSPVSQREAEG